MPLALGSTLTSAEWKGEECLTTALQLQLLSAVSLTGTLPERLSTKKARSGGSTESRAGSSLAASQLAVKEAGCTTETERSLLMTSSSPAVCFRPHTLYSQWSRGPSTRRAQMFSTRDRGGGEPSAAAMIALARTENASAGTTMRECVMEMSALSQATEAMSSRENTQAKAEGKLPKKTTA
jgi:hypothetical protein